MSIRIHYVDSHSMQHRIIYGIGNSYIFELPHLFYVLFFHRRNPVLINASSILPYAGGAKCLHAKQNIASRSREYSAHWYLSNQALTNDRAWLFPSLCSGYSCKCNWIGIPPADWDRSIGAVSCSLGFCEECPITFVEHSASIFNIFTDIAAYSVSLLVVEVRFLYLKNLSICVCVWAMFCKKMFGNITVF